MLMAATTATQMGRSARSSSSSSISPQAPPPPWHPVVLVPNQHHHHQQDLYDLDVLVTPSPSPSPTTPTTTQRLRPASRRAAKPRRPRQSRKLPPTYISADAASFRRMVHQVTGADHALLPPGPGPAAAPEPEVLCRPTPAPPSRGALTTTTTLTLPTLDTSAFLMRGAAQGGVSGRAAPARPGVSCCHGSAAVDPGAAALQVKAEACGGGGGGFRPSLESWDEDDDALF